LALVVLAGQPVATITEPLDQIQYFLQLLQLAAGMAYLETQD
jgi:hypothetical protein